MIAIEAVIGSATGHITVLQQTPTGYTELLGDANPFKDWNSLANQNANQDYSAPVLVDVDGDGDLDAVIGVVDGTLRYLENMRINPTDPTDPIPAPPLVDGQPATVYVGADGKVYGDTSQTGQPYTGQLNGTAGNDRIAGTSGDDWIWGGDGGNDIIDAGQGNNQIYIGPGSQASVIFSGNGDDVIEVGNGSHWINAGHGNNFVYSLDMGGVNGTTVVTTGNGDDNLWMSVVDAQFAYEEGENDRSLDSWRREHWHYFSRVLPEIGKEPSPDMLLVCERFRVVDEKD